jgi:hypothetical protein
MRPSDFRSAERVYDYCTKGLPEEKRLGPADDDKRTVTIPSWVAMIRSCFEDRGMDTVMRLYNAEEEEELYMLSDENWGRVDGRDVTNWVKELKRGVLKDGQDTELHPACPFDQDNLAWSGKFIMNSITSDLWEIIEKEVGSNPTGPEAFFAIIQEGQVSTASMVQALTEQLKRMSIKSEPGQNVQTFTNKIVDIARRINGSFLPVPNLHSLVLLPYLQCDVESFRLYATDLHMRADRSLGSTSLSIYRSNNATDPAWMASLTDLKIRFREIRAAGLWTPLNNRKQPDEMKALRAELKALQQTVSATG